MSPFAFSTGTLSPVKVDSSVLNPISSINSASAGMSSPTSKAKISPGTTSLASIVIFCPSRITVVTGFTIFFKASIARSALNSCINPITTTKTIMKLMTQKLITSPMP